MSKPIITVENLGKAYRLGLREEKYPTFRDALVGAAKAPFKRFQHLSGGGNQDDLFWALRDVSFEVQPGEVVGIIGRNGAGKSTLLKVLSRITDPTAGRAILRGRVASLLEVGTGFHPELSGRENIYLNGSILGMKKVEIDRKFDEIVAFAEVEKFLDTPVKRYSSGMYVRLAFAVAAHLEPEILIVDEVLAVGDAQFQKKCLGKMQEVAQGQGRTVLFVSHNMDVVLRLCSRGVLISGGAARDCGNIEASVQTYLQEMQTPPLDLNAKDVQRLGNGEAMMVSFKSFQDGLETTQLTAGKEVVFEVQYQSTLRNQRANLLLTFFDGRDTALFNLRNNLTGDLFQLSSLGTVTCRIPRLPLNRGRYRIAAAIQDATGTTLDHVSNAGAFDVDASQFYPTGRHPESRYSPTFVEHSFDHQSASTL